jgi:hypothetical protein
MKSRGLQELIKKIFSDEEARSQFISNPDSVLAKFSLTGPEKRAVLSTHAKLGLVTGNSGQLEATLDTAIPWLAATPKV